MAKSLNKVENAWSNINKIPNTIKEYEVAFKLFKNNKPDAKSFIAAFEDGLDVSQKQKVLDNAHPTCGMSGDIINRQYFCIMLTFNSNH